MSNNTPNFIGSWKTTNPQLSSDLISYFEDRSENHYKGSIGKGISLSDKDSWDMSITPKQIENEKIFHVYFAHLKHCLDSYQTQWPYLYSLGKLEIGIFNIQKYDVGGHYKALHAERTNGTNMQRVLAWMTYLNDVQIGGETVFPYQNTAFRPEKGKTLIWPAEWTHAHYAERTQEEKYIITGWLQFE